MGLDELRTEDTPRESESTRRDGDADEETTTTHVGYLIDVHSWHLPGHVAEDGTELDVNPGDRTVASMRRLAREAEESPKNLASFAVLEKKKRTLYGNGNGDWEGGDGDGGEDDYYYYDVKYRLAGASPFTPRHV